MNHYGLSMQDLASAITVKKIDLGRDIELARCIGDRDPSNESLFVDMTFKVDLYVYAPALALASAGNYMIEYSNSWMDIDDVPLSTNARGVGDAVLDQYALRLLYKQHYTACFNFL